MAWSESWKRNHPDWHHITWAAEDNSNLAYLMSPIMKGLYDKMPQVAPLAFHHFNSEACPDSLLARDQHVHKAKSQISSKHLHL